MVNNALKIQPDIVVLYHNLNDLATLHSEGSYWNKDPSRSLIVWENLAQGQPISPGEMARSLDTVQLLSALFVVIGRSHIPNITVSIERLFELLRGKNGNSSQHVKELTHEPKQTRPMETEAIAGSFRRSLLTFVSVSRIWGAEPVLMTQANRFPDDIEVSPSQALKKQVAFWNRRYQMDYADIKQTFDRMNEVIREVAAKEGVLLIDLAAHIEKKKENFYDLIHFTNKASLEAASLIAGALSGHLSERLK